MSSQKISIFLYSTNITIFKGWIDIISINKDQYILLKTSVMRMVYIIIIFVAIFFMLLRSTIFFHLCIRASKTLHKEMFTKFLKAPMIFFFSTPPGNILNRFSKDIGAADELFPKALLNVLAVCEFLLVLSMRLCVKQKVELDFYFCCSQYQFLSAPCF